MAKKKVLLMGKAHSGKTSMRRYDNQIPKSRAKAHASLSGCTLAVLKELNMLVTLFSCNSENCSLARCDVAVSFLPITWPVIRHDCPLHSMWSIIMSVS
jgi:hypothetical protein